MIQLTLPYPPSVNSMYRAYRGRVVLSERGRAYKEEVAGLCAAAGLTEPLTGNVEMELWVYRPRMIGDLDNICKAILDAVEGWIYQNDKQVRRLMICRFESKLNPRVELKAWVISL